MTQTAGNIYESRYGLRCEVIREYSKKDTGKGFVVVRFCPGDRPGVRFDSAWFYKNFKPRSDEES